MQNLIACTLDLRESRVCSLTTHDEGVTFGLAALFVRSSRTENLMISFTIAMKPNKPTVAFLLGAVKGSHLEIAY